MRALAAVMLTAVGCYFAFGLGNAWWLAWVAPVPVLWFAFGETRAWKAFLAAWAALALGLTSLVQAYVHVFPGPVLALDILVPALPFALAAAGAQQVNKAFGPVAAMLTLAALWAGCDLLLSFYPGIGSIASPAAAEVIAPVLIQSASLVGFAGVTFLLGIVAAGIALSLRTRNPVPVLIAVGLFAANAVYGYVRMSQPAADAVRVALINSNTYEYAAPRGGTQAEMEQRSLAVIDAYAAEIRKLRSAKVQLVVLPENIAQIAGPWHEAARAKLAAAADGSGATVIGGFNAMRDGARRNMAWAFEPGATNPVSYEKRHLVPGLESEAFTPGPGPRMLRNGVEPEICFDMDFPHMLRHDAVAMQPRLFAVPASEIGTHGDWSNLGPAADDWFHGRNAMLRTVENGVPMARTAGRGLLTLTDRYGRVVTKARTAAPFTTLVGDLPLDGRGGATLYDRIGDTFGWLCLLLGAGLAGVSCLRGPAKLRSR